MTPIVSKNAYRLNGKVCRLGIVQYPNKNTALCILSEDCKRYEDDISTNLGPLPNERLFALDVNNYPEMERCLIESNVARPTGNSVKSGFVTYPIYILTEDFINSLERKIR